jgi:hypothetical protein
MKDAIIYAGYSRLADGTMKFRTATSEARVNQLVAFGEEVHMILINGVYSKSSAAKELLRLDHARGVKELEQFYSAQVRDENPFKKTTRVVKVKVPNMAMVHLVGAQVETEELSTAEARKIRNEWNRKHAHLSYDGE